MQFQQENSEQAGGKQELWSQKGRPLPGISPINMLLTLTLKIDSCEVGASPRGKESWSAKAEEIVRSVVRQRLEDMKPI
jgi:hypothetical protein